MQRFSYLAIAIALGLYPFLVEISSYPKIKDVAEKYQITYDNILYLGEDGGFGLFSEDSYKSGVGFLPTRAIVSKTEEEFLEQYEPILSSKEYKYVILVNHSKFLFFQEVVEKYYDKVEITRFGTLYKAKEQHSFSY